MQVVALCQAPFLLDDPNVGMIFPADAIARAKHYLSLTSGGLGMSFIREFRSCFILAYTVQIKSKFYFIFNQVLTVIQEVFREFGKKLLSSLNGVMDIQGDYFMLIIYAMK